MADSFLSHLGTPPVEDRAPSSSFYVDVPLPEKTKPHTSFGLQVEEDLTQITGLSKLNLQSLGDSRTAQQSETAKHALEVLEAGDFTEEFRKELAEALEREAARSKKSTRAKT